MKQFLKRLFCKHWWYDNGFIGWETKTGKRFIYRQCDNCGKIECINMNPNIKDYPRKDI
jgi:hypothetical protein